MMRRLRPILRTSTFVGAAVIVLIWVSIGFHLRVEWEKSEQASIQDTSNLARVFEEHIIRLLKEIDKVLVLARASYAQDAEHFDLASWVRNPLLQSDVTVQISFIGPDGMLVATSVSAVTPQLDLSDREHFRAHLDTDRDELFISKPVIGRSSGKASIQLSRRVSAADGTFRGVIVMSLDPYYLARFYESIDIGRDGAVALIGLDGIVRANAGFKVDMMGQSMAGRRVLRDVASAGAGWFVTRGATEGIVRLMSYRVVKGFPLVVEVGKAEREIFADYGRDRRLYHAIAAGLTLLVLFVIGLAIRHQAKLTATREALKASDAHAREKSRELEVTLDHMSQGIMMVDENRNVAVINRRTIELLDLPQEFLWSRPKLGEIFGYLWEHGEFGRDGEMLSPQVREFIKRGALDDGLGVYERPRPNGMVLEINSKALAGGGVVRTFTDVTEHRKSIEQIAHMARHDTLTGLANRALLRERMDQALGRLHRYGEPFAMFCLDLDRFKAVNDTLGHAAGDTLLKLVGQRLTRCLRENDTIARLGGDEFAILLIAAAHAVDMAALAQRVVDLVSRPYDLDGSEATIGASVGIVMAPGDGCDPEELFRKADLALYRVKAEGRGNYRFFQDEMEAEAKARRAIERQLRTAIERGEFKLRYQPIVNLASGKIVAVEALLRWDHPQRGLLEPSEFVVAAEEIGLMTAIGGWVIRQACSDAAGWQDIKLAVNVSQVQFKRSRLIDLVRDVLTESKLPARRLQIEVTEGILLGQDTHNLGVLHSLRALGIGVVLDGFGTGYSALGYLQAFRFDKIKIDHSLVRSLTAGSGGIPIVVAIAGLAKNLGVSPAAEGVETEEQEDLLRIAGCIEAQGGLFSPPRTASEISEMLAGAAILAESAA
jgi:diguanylate cyclase (GGDEF)-like protein